MFFKSIQFFLSLFSIHHQVTPRFFFFISFYTHSLKSINSSLLQVSMMERDFYLGRILTGRITSGIINVGDRVHGIRSTDDGVQKVEEGRVCHPSVSSVHSVDFSNCVLDGIKKFCLLVLICQCYSILLTDYAGNKAYEKERHKHDHNWQCRSWWYNLSGWTN